MSSKSSEYLRRHWKLLLNIVTVGALVILVFAIHKQLITTFERLHTVDFWALILLVPIEWVNYYGQAKLYQSLFKIIGNTVGYKELFKISLELNFVNSVFPSVGASGIGYFGVRLRRDGISGGKASLVQIMKLMLVLISFELLLILGLLFLAVQGHANNFTILIAGSLTTLLVVLTFIVMFLVGSKHRISATLVALNRVAKRLMTIVHLEKHHIDTERIAHWADELHDNYILIRGQYDKLSGPLLYALLANATEVAAVYVVYLAFGHWVNVGAVILAYAVANFAGLISVLPGGVGVYEAIMLGVLTATGIPASLSFPVIIMYRVFNTIVQLPPGYFYYQQTLRGGQTSEPSAGE